MEFVIGLIVVAAVVFFVWKRSTKNEVVVDATPEVPAAPVVVEAPVVEAKVVTPRKPRAKKTPTTAEE
jgi:hypothetical protein